jgi:hypothetical protein
MNFNTLEEDLCQLLKCNKERLYNQKNIIKYVSARNLLCLHLYKHKNMTYRDIAKEMNMCVSLVHKNMNNAVYKKRNQHLFITFFDEIIDKYKLNKLTNENFR